MTDGAVAYALRQEGLAWKDVARRMGREIHGVDRGAVVTVRILARDHALRGHLPWPLRVRSTVTRSEMAWRLHLAVGPRRFTWREVAEVMGIDGPNKSQVVSTMALRWARRWRW